MTTESLRVLHMLPNMQLGGGQILLLRNIEAMRKLGVESTVCSVWRDQGLTMTRRFEDAGIPCYNLKLRRSLLPLAVRELVHLVRARGIQLIHTNNTSSDRRMGVLAGKLTSLPVLNSFHSMEARPSPYDRLEQLYLRHAYAGGIAVSETVKKAWLPHAERIGLPAHLVEVVHPGLELRGYRPSPTARARIRAELQIAEDAPVVVNVARFAPGKGQLRLLETMQSVVRAEPKTRLLLVGDGSERESIESKVRALGLRNHVIMVGQRNDIPDLLAASDVFAFTSEGEGFGLVVLEAMACGIPVVAFELPVLHEIAPPQTAVLVPPGRCETLAVEVLQLLWDPDRRMALGARGREHVELHFTQGNTAQRILQVYLQTLARFAALRRALVSAREEAPEHSAGIVTELPVHRQPELMNVQG